MYPGDMQKQQHHVGAIGGAYAADNMTTASATGLMRLADQITEAAASIEHATSQLQTLALGIHGPRPEPVNEASGIKQSGHDNLAARVSNLMDAVSRLHRSLDSVVR